MAVHVYDRYLKADTPAEAAAFAARLGLPADRLRMADSPRWHWLLEGPDHERAVAAGAKPVGVEVFQQLVAAAPAADGHPSRDRLGAGTGAPTSRRPARWNPRLRRHSWERHVVAGWVLPHWWFCAWCGIGVENKPVQGSSAWYKEWWWPLPLGEGQVDGTTATGAKVPRCPGPRSGSSDPPS